MNVITLRSMIREDIPHIAAWIAQSPLWQRYRLDASKASRQLEQALERNEMLLAAVPPEGPVCGLAWCMVGGAFGRSTYLRLLGIEETYRSAGVGALLLNEAERLAAESGQSMVLLVSDFNTGAQHFYQRQGYTQVGALPGYVLPDITELIYWKPLNSSMTSIPDSPLAKEAHPNL